jgi:hypothetical protein
VEALRLLAAYLDDMDPAGAFDATLCPCRPGDLQQVNGITVALPPAGNGHERASRSSKATTWALDNPLALYAIAAAWPARGTFRFARVEP